VREGLFDKLAADDWTKNCTAIQRVVASHELLDLVVLNLSLRGRSFDSGAINLLRFK
jgi:hypothetical protein